MTEITSSKAALIVVDMQVGTIANARSVPAEQLLTAVTYAIDQFRAATRPVIFAISTGTPPGVTQYGSQGRTWPSEDTQLLPEIHTSVDDLTVHRATWSAFTSTPLAEHLTEAEVSEVVIVGIATTFGVESTARSAADLGYNVIVLADAVSDPDQGGHDRTLARVIPALGQVLTTKDYTPKSPE
ncbi:nicotinamidase-related amidase [Frondihabitans sp. PhB188]|uniref:cysteine hydrolase family protein n=1 Tax=Frondihabitans sp. PhB188 TaxID=2485200 RepID=UPI000F97193D|nr:cysteine hydrolase [Frondihabitans sp. PhB188]ROQ31036.1 nicotinamidase-related amidase [Frondihabitans sp. PhB188]